MTLSNEILQRFCASPNDVRLYLQTPFRQAGMIYATNGHFFVEIPDDGRALQNTPPDRLPKFKPILDKLKPAEFVPIPDMLEMIPCAVCDGKGAHARVECPECDGEGEFDHGSHAYECKHCDGEGYIGSEGVPTTCLACDGIGEQLIITDKTQVGPAFFASRYLRFLVRTLPGPVTIAVSGAAGSAEFRFIGGRGVLMPMRV